MAKSDVAHLALNLDALMGLLMEEIAKVKDWLCHTLNTA